MSVRTRHVCFFLDYGALTLYSLGSAVAYSAYIFPEEWAGSAFHQSYVSFAVLNTIISTTLSCYSRFTEMGQLKFSKAIRTFAFAYPYVYNSVPLYYRLYLCTVRGCSEKAISMHYMHTAFAWLTCFLFVTHLPERLAPGRFDFIGHSHQLFHICGIIGTRFQMEALLVDMTERREQLLPYMPAPNFSQTIGPVLASTVVSLIIIAAFSMTLYTMPKFSRRGSKRKRK
uniref:Progestin and adipoQ receptor family member 5 n=2 Tax=Varanus komodoensis TaxID=61221 RepID=A0A8D2LQE1_VARKO